MPRARHDGQITDVDSGFVEALYRKYRRRVLRRASTMMGDLEAAKDVTQEVFLRAFGARADFAADESPLKWLYRVTTNMCLNRLRDAGRHRDILERISPTLEPTVGSRGDMAHTVGALMQNVSPELQEIAVYYFVDQMSQGEISARLSVSRRTIGYRLEEFRSVAGRFALGARPRVPAS